MRSFLACGSVLLALAGLAFAAGCQGTKEQEHEHAVAAVETFLSACARDEDAEASELLTGLAQRRFVHGVSTLASCTQVLDPGPFPSEEEAKRALEEAKVGHVEAESGFATVDLELPHKRVTVPVEQVRGKWLIADPDDPGFAEGS